MGGVTSAPVEPNATSKSGKPNEPSEHRGTGGPTDPDATHRNRGSKSQTPGEVTGPREQVTGSSERRLEQATLGGGCFWCLEPVFEELEGVVRVEPGYAGGHVPNPTYEQVCTGTTGHAEVVQVTFDPEIIAYRDLLEVFFAIHDPTTPNRQGHDVGPQYRSIILYHSPEQKSVAEAVIRELEASRRWKDPIVTQVVPFEAFYPAEEYHHRFYRKNPYYPYCQVVIEPKMRKLRAAFAAWLKSDG